MKGKGGGDLKMFPMFVIGICAVCACMLTLCVCVCVVCSHIRAGTELTWDYNYEVGSVPGKVLYCYCGSAECRGRLL